jgi:hypothetical protein
MHVVELPAGVAILDPQPMLAVFRDDLKFPVIGDIEALGPSRIDAGILEVPLREQIYLGRSPPLPKAKEGDNQHEQ